MEPAWGGAGGRESGKGVRFRVLVKIAGGERGLDSISTWISFGAGVREGQAWGQAKSRAYSGWSHMRRDLDGGGATFGSRVVGRTRPGK